jgi:hypothetical protein
MMQPRSLPLKSAPHDADRANRPTNADRSCHHRGDPAHRRDAASVLSEQMTRHAYTRDHVAPRNLRESLQQRLATRAFDRHCKARVHRDCQHIAELQVELNLSCHFRNVEHDTGHQKDDGDPRSASHWYFYEYDFAFSPASCAGLVRDRIQVGAKVVPRNAGLSFDRQYEFSGDATLRPLQPVPDL